MNQGNIEQYTIYNDDENQRLDSYLADVCPYLSRSYIQKQIKNNNVLVNNAETKPSYIVKAGDVVYINFKTAENYIPQPQDLPLDIKYEDNCMLVVNKPAGMLTHPTVSEYSDTLVNALLFNYAENLSTSNGHLRPGIVHRLDRNTSGLLMIAKNNDTYDFLKRQMQEHSIVKKYFAVVNGVFDNDDGTIITNIGRNPKKPEKMAVTEEGKEAITHYSVLERFDKHTLLEITIETGRTHQIRVHMSYIKHPIVNDTLYGAPSFPVKTQEQVLQAHYLKFVSPSDNCEHIVDIEFDNDIIRTLNYLRSKK